MGLFTFLYQKTFVPQIGEAEAAARHTLQQQQQLLLLQQQQRSQQGILGSTKGTRTGGHGDSATSQQDQLETATGDPAIAALLHAAKSLTSSQLVSLQRSIAVMAASKAAAGD